MTYLETWWILGFLIKQASGSIDLVVPFINNLFVCSAISLFINCSFLNPFENWSLLLGIFLKLFKIWLNKISHLLRRWIKYSRASIIWINCDRTLSGYQNVRIFEKNQKMVVWKKKENLLKPLIIHFSG